MNTLLPLMMAAAQPQTDHHGESHTADAAHAAAEIATNDSVTAILADALAIGSLAMGLFFLIVGAVGMVRLPDVYHRIHAVSKCSTLGLLGLLLAAIFHVGTLPVAAKALLTLVFAFTATPVGSHVLAKAALAAKTDQWDGTLSDQHAQDQDQDQVQNQVQETPGAV